MTPRATLRWWCQVQNKRFCNKCGTKHKSLRDEGDGAGGGSKKRAVKPEPGTEGASKKTKTNGDGASDGAAGPDDGRIMITLRSQSGDEMAFRVKPTAVFQKVMNAWCKTKGVAENLCRFMFDGDQLVAGSSLVDQNAEIEDGDIVDVFQNQTGGFHA